MTGIVVWLDSFEWLALGIIFILLFISIRRERNERLKTMNTSHRTAATFGYAWAILGLVIGLLGIIDFILSVLRFRNWRRYFMPSLWVTAINTLILLPMWLLLLAIRLYVIRCHFEDEEEQRMSSSQQQRNGHDNNNQERPPGTARNLTRAVELVSA